jgi:branched-chain amino acid transport system substrate-binding protein
LAVGQVAERNGRILVTTVSYATSITGAQCNPAVFRVNANAYQQSAALTAWLKKSAKGKRYFFIGPDYEMGRSTVAAFKHDVTRLGGDDVGETFAPLGAKDFSPYLGQIRAARPDVIMTATAGNDTVRLLTQLKEYGMINGQLTLAGASGAVSQENIGAMGGAAEGFLSAAAYSVDLDTPANKKFVAAFKSETKSDPDLFGADTYGVIYLFKKAIEKAGGTDLKTLRPALEGMTWETPQGNKTIRKGDHQAMVDMLVVRVEGSGFKIVGRVPGADAIGPNNCNKW